MEDNLFVLPSFLQDESSVLEIQQKMLDSINLDIDKSEGQFAWDFCIPASIEKSEMIQMQLSETLKLVFPKFAYEKWLERHGKIRGIIKKEDETDDELRDRIKKHDASQGRSFVGTKSDYVTWATQGTGVESVFVEMPDDIKHEENTAIGQDGTYVTIYMIKDNKGKDISRYDNDLDITEEELISAINNNKPFDQGSYKYYKMMIYKKIMAPHNEIDRLAPVNTRINIQALSKKDITITAEVTIDETKDIKIADIESNFKKALESYASDAKLQSVVLHSKIAAILSGINGVFDYHNLQMSCEDNCTSIEISSYQIPTFKVYLKAVSL